MSLSTNKTFTKELTKSIQEIANKHGIEMMDKYDESILLIGDVSKSEEPIDKSNHIN